MNVDELEDFKAHINLSEYAAAQGYEMDRRASSKNSVLMRHCGGDNIVIACGTDRHWIYFSVRDDADNGTIIDFVQNRKGVKLGGVRQELRPWIGGARPVARPDPDLFAHEIEPISNPDGACAHEASCFPPLPRGRAQDPGGPPAKPAFRRKDQDRCPDQRRLSPCLPGRPLRLRDGVDPTLLSPAAI